MNKFFLLVLIFVFPLLILQSQSLTDSLIVYYPFNGDALDYSGNELHGILDGPELTTDRYGNDNSAYFFDGINDVIEFPNSQLLKPDFPFSVSYWVKLETLEFDFNRYFSTEFQFSNYSGCWMASKNGIMKLSFGGNIGGAGLQYRRTKMSGVEISIGSWYHVVGVVRGAEDMDIYLNGINTGGSYEGTGPNIIGYGGSAGKVGSTPGQAVSPDPRYFWGKMDEFGFWNRELSQQEIMEIFNNGIISDIPESIVNESFSVSPNPTNGNIEIHPGSPGLKINQIQILNISGEEIQFQHSHQHINISHAPAGIYFVKLLFVDGTIGFKKIVKKG